jgi:hypothetical protein
MDLDDFKNQGFILRNGVFVSKQKKSKYRNTKITIDGLQFDSIKEGNYYTQLKLLKKSGGIIDFERQLKFDIHVNSIHIANYFLDFKVIYPDGKIEYIDIKGQDKKTKGFIKTDVFSLKKKLVEAIYGIKIKIL